ncbi:UDP-glucose 4-epimerase [Branchiibius hedensis]|uniref:UDP-glucose 4-epimerase n=1 Tax=Branchiibius hedensis TaxID=672460 RepID=A0A2Y8ZKB2_9MICO|nr:NAD-dependent epimerase/dehydratase family protein [Branchiibius hedensis]PWJ24023.1 UDP-glucose 4-epimerase [Branchiibius hedensis]SSA32841.1 UDP-glucose 4-epimerase [Branchiibius hedensis]
MTRTLLVTGVARVVGGAMCRRLSLDPDIDRILAVDTVAPPHDLGRAQFVRADIRNPVISRIIDQEEVDTVLHLGVITSSRLAGNRSRQKDINVVGTMQLLAACQNATSVRRLVVKSSGAVYGASKRDPARFTEQSTATPASTRGFARDSVEVEGYVRGFARRRPGVSVVMLRMANVMGPGLHTALTDYFDTPVLPVPFGYDGRFQLLHLDDALEALRLAAKPDAPTGTFNVAGDGILTLRQAARIAHRPVVPALRESLGLLGPLIQRTWMPGFDANETDFLSYGRALDTTKMREVLKFEPRYTTRATFEQRYSPIPALAGPTANWTDRHE